MSKLRTGCKDSDKPALPNDTALYLIYDAVSRRKCLIHGSLDDRFGRHCAIGAFWADNPHTALGCALIDEVATVNDSIGRQATPQERWKKVRSWLRWKLRMNGRGKPAMLEARGK